jgi:hypothetical protein
MALLDFTKTAEKRQRELDDLFQGSYKKTTKIASGQITETVGPFYWGPLYNAYSTYSIKVRSTRDIWARVRYKPSSETFKYLGVNNRQAFEDLLIGYRPSLSTVWNALPWSWLLDWCTTAGDFFAATRNELGLVVDDVAIMTHTKCVLDQFIWTNNPFDAVFTEIPGYLYEVKQRDRWEGSPVIAAYMPNLGLKQMSILAALANRWRFARI